MTPPSINPEATSSSGRVAAASRALDSGQLVVLPTETLAGIAANASDPVALDRLRALTHLAGPAAGEPTLTWHAASLNVVLDAIPVSSPLQRRMMHRLAPGPVRFLIDVGDEVSRIVRDLGALPDTIESAGTIAVRVPDHPVARAVLAAAKAPIVITRLSAAGWRSLADVPRGQAAERLGIAAVLDDPPEPKGIPSTTIRLRTDGSAQVEHEGALEDRIIRKRTQRSILFVCTGNTCRSPMAEAIARHVVAETQQHHPPAARAPFHIASAGVAAGSGQGMTPEAVAALQGLGIDPGSHRSRELTRQLLAEADEVYTMTESHRRAVLAMDPSAAGRVFALDPSGAEIPDPIGTSLSIYDATARRLREVIAARLAEDAG